MLEIVQMRFGIAHLARGQPLVQAIRRERPGRFADIPFDRMQPIAAIGDMGHAQILARRQQVLDPLGYQRSQRNLEGVAADIDIGAQACARMQIDPIAADADAIRKWLR